MKKLSVKFLLVFGSFALSLLTVELFLRIEFVHYGELVDQGFSRTGTVISRNELSSFVVRNPDSQLEHECKFNEYSSPQYRHFNTSDLSSNYVIGFFGDSFTENIRLAYFDNLQID